MHHHHWVAAPLLFSALLSGCGENAPTTSVHSPASVTAVQPAHDTLVTSSHFLGSGHCEGCHAGPGGVGVPAFVSDWRGSMMAQSARDPLWQAKVASEIHRNPGLRDEIETTCSRCHMPLAHVEALAANAHPRIIDDGFLNPTNLAYDLAAEGVSCTLCHQIDSSPDLGTAARFDGNFDIAVTTGTYPALFGPFSAPLTRPMEINIGFSPVQSAHIQSSELCATCHNLITPVVDAVGLPLGLTFHEQAVYSEWQQSSFADPASTVSCQTCHMPTEPATHAVSTIPNFAPARSVGSHRIIGGNTQMLSLLEQHATTLGVEGIDFASTIAATRQLLATAVTLNISNAKQVAGDLSFDLLLNNHSGHKFPTSYPSRRAWIYLRVEDAAGNLLFESGASDGEGRISGADGDSDATLFEPHHNLITTAGQVPIYEAVMGNSDGAVNHTLLRASQYLKENRLLPTGLTKSAADPSVATVGNALGDADFQPGGDQLHYQLAGLGGSGNRIIVELRFQTLGYPFIRDLLQDSASVPLVERFKTLYEATSLRYEVIASTQLTLP